MPAVVIALIIAAALGGGTAVAAEHALPGDALWGFKTTVNENVEHLFVHGDDASTNLDLSIVATRLDEAQALAARGRLDAGTQQALVANLRTHVQPILDRVTLLESTNKSQAADLVSRFQAVLAQHTKNLAGAPASFTAYIHGLFDQASNL